ncbi:lipase [Candidatus Synechococcus calcipolaris G9]|uniref:Lipase n=1 Tax=Candidatus Synechococcus calcipolaris G9 TaxID=1497997 RepID=A0ABT6EUR8_9SYNE|nr:lipase [Candidatus Synechococcus calcipolaris]MDG2989573.1 lipase [Candidatus Synechococcus calcipolaris G9]
MALPTLPVVILPGYLAAAKEYEQFRDTLMDRGLDVTIVPLRSRSWLPTLGGRPVTPILHILDQTIKQVLGRSPATQINLIGHSAGGWISRIYLGSVSYGDRQWAGHKNVRTLVTLGTPHTSQERWTRRNLDFVNITYPGAFHDSVDYICIAGKAIYGQPKGSLGNWFTYQSYKLTCGEGACWGDGVTPVDSAHLEGAKNLTLPDVLHSPRSRLRNNLTAPWYGSPEIIDQWITPLMS